MAMTAFEPGDRVKVGLESLESSVVQGHYGKYGTIESVDARDIIYPYTVKLDDGTVEAFAARELLIDEFVKKD